MKHNSRKNKTKARKVALKNNKPSSRQHISYVGNYDLSQKIAMANSSGADCIINLDDLLNPSLLIKNKATGSWSQVIISEF
jgi:hypothetical protein